MIYKNQIAAKLRRAKEGRCEGASPEATMAASKSTIEFMKALRAEGSTVSWPVSVNEWLNRLLLELLELFVTVESDRKEMERTQ